MQETSILAYVKLLESLGNKQLEVLKAIKQIEPCSNTMISNHMNIPINCVTGRVNELRKKLLVKQAKKDICPITNEKVIFWKVLNSQYA